MKIKLLLAGLAIAGLVVSSAVAAPAGGQGKPEIAGPGLLGSPEGKVASPIPLAPTASRRSRSS